MGCNLATCSEKNCEQPRPHESQLKLFLETNFDFVIAVEKLHFSKILPNFEKFLNTFFY